MLYRLIKGSTQIDGVWYHAWENNVLDLTPSQAKSLGVGKRIIPLAEEVEEEETGEGTEAPTKRRGARK